MCKTIKQKVKFRAKPSAVYTLLTKSKSHQAITGKPARIGKRVGDRFSCYGGSIFGVNVDLVPGKRIVQAWQAKDFPEGIFSMATFDLESTASGWTLLTLTHRGVPKDLIARISLEWKKLYWDKIKLYLAERQSAKKP